MTFNEYPFFDHRVLLFLGGVELNIETGLRSCHVAA